MTELPLRIYDQPGGVTVRCLCGLELARMRKGLAAGRLMARTAGINREQMQLAPDVTTPGLMVMVLHASKCERGKSILAEMTRVWSGL